MCVCVCVRLLFPLIRPLSVNWHSTDAHTHADLQIPQLMTALPQPANNNLSLLFPPLFLTLYFCRLDVGVEVKRGGERSRKRKMRKKEVERDEEARGEDDRKRGGWGIKEKACRR